MTTLREFSAALLDDKDSPYARAREELAGLRATAAQPPATGSRAESDAGQVARDRARRELSEIAKSIRRMEKMAVDGNRGGDHG